MNAKVQALQLILNAHSFTDDACVKKHLATAARTELSILLGSRKAASGYEVTQAEKHLFYDKGKLDAVKAYKNRTGCGLMESKKAIEYELTNGPRPPHYPEPPF